MKMLRGIELRYVLTMHLARHGRSTIRELVDALSFHGFAADSPANKSVSDALRAALGVPPQVGQQKHLDGMKDAESKP